MSFSFLFGCQELGPKFQKAKYTQIICNNCSNELSNYFTVNEQSVKSFNHLFKICYNNYSLSFSNLHNYFLPSSILSLRDPPGAFPISCPKTCSSHCGDTSNNSGFLWRHCIIRSKNVICSGYVYPFAQREMIATACPG